VDNFGELVGEIEIQGTAKIVDCVGCKYDEDFRRKGRVRSSRELKDGMVLGAEVSGDQWGVEVLVYSFCAWMP